MAAEALSVVQCELSGLGHAYAPAGDGPFPAIVLLHGSEGAGGWLGHRDAALFAAHRFLAYPLPYAVGGGPWIGGDIWNVALDHTEQALERLRALPICNGKVGIYGWSRGGEHALLATALMAAVGSAAQPDAVAAHAAPDRTFAAWRNTFARRPDDAAPPPHWDWQEARYDPDLPAWSWRGEPVPHHLPIELEAYAGPVFLSTGDQDEIWPAAMTSRMADRLRGAGRTPEVHIYEGQPHMPGPAAWNRHHGLLLDFFRRSLA